jgi:hypothetical protein
MYIILTKCISKYRMLWYLYKEAGNSGLRLVRNFDKEAGSSGCTWRGVLIGVKVS